MSSADKNSTRVNLSSSAYYILAYFISESGELNQIVLWLMWLHQNMSLVKGFNLNEGIIKKKYWQLPVLLLSLLVDARIILM